MNLPPVIVDTTVVVAGMITATPDSPTRKLLDGMLAARFPFLLSSALLDEYRRVLLRPKLKRLHGLAPSEIDAILEAIVANAVWREPQPGYEAPDRGDDHLWALLAAVPGSILITGDKRLLENPPQFGSVVSPAGWLRLPDGGK